MPNDPLREALRRLPAETASPGFTAGVLQRLDRPAPAALAWRLAPLAAGLLVAGLALPTAWFLLGSGRAAGPDPSAPHQLTSVPDSRTETVSGDLATAGPPPNPAVLPLRTDRRARVLQELAALQEERKRLDEQWRDYRRLARAAEPVLYLGGNDKVDIVFDLRRVPPETLAGDVIPAAMTNRSDNR